MNSDSVAPILMVNLGKRAAGRNLDGQEWDAVPMVADT